MENKIILIDKPAGISSFGVVAKVRGKLKVEFGHKVKVGHTGTLDPFATGLLILLSGKMTKKSNEFLKQDKEYIATLKLGYNSTTGDPEGEITKWVESKTEEKPFEERSQLTRSVDRVSPVTTEQRSEEISNLFDISSKAVRYSEGKTGASEGGFSKGFSSVLRDNPLNDCKDFSSGGDVVKMTSAEICPSSEEEFSDVLRDNPTNKEILNVLKSLTGEIEQIPPKYSAIKINGQRAYKLARQNKDFEIPSRKVKIYSIKILEYNYPYLKIKTKVSSGTYIRTLAEDIGKKLGTGAYLTELRRTKIGDYSVEDAEKLVL